MKKLIAFLVIVIALVILFSSFNKKAVEEVVVADKVLEDSFIVSNHLVFQKGAKLIAKKDLTVQGILSCEDGPLVIEVSGNVTIDGTLSCVRSESAGDTAEGISIIAKGGIRFSKDAVVSSNGNVEIVRDASKLARSVEAVNLIYEEAAKDSGEGARIGPFVPDHPTRNITGAAKVSFHVNGKVMHNVNLPFVNIAHAQTPTDKEGNSVDNVVIAGTWHIGDGSTPPSGLQIPTPPKNVHKIIVYFDFGQNGNVALENFHLVGPDGRDGESDQGKTCNARGSDGENAFRMLVNASSISINEFRLELGNGGNGGAAETTKDCKPGIANGGKGGEAGNFKMIALGSIDIASFHIVPGKGGSGGQALAFGKDGDTACPGTVGGDATATGGDGGKNKKELSALGAVSGIGNVVVDEVRGGFGGEAISTAGKGGAGNGCNCKGGAGGKATATGGKGGDASVSVPPPVTATAMSGNGGDVSATAGDGGVGGACPLKPKGGDGGKGGNAKASAGAAGASSQGQGDVGNVKVEDGGNGGDGGVGCGPGAGGAPGTPNGKPGKPGTKQCPDDKTDKQTGTTPPTGTTENGATDQTPGNTGGSSISKTVKAIGYRGKYIPTDELMIMSHSGCNNQPHWHSKPEPGLPVKATDGSTVSDPGPECGFGTTATVPVIDVKVK